MTAQSKRLTLIGIAFLILTSVVLVGARFGSTGGERVQTMYWGSGAATSDGTQCADPVEVTINSGPKQFTVICAETDTATLTGSLMMPDGWNAGTVTFQLSYIQTAADTGSMKSDIECQARGAAETVNNTWSAEIAIDDAAVTGSNALDTTTSAAVTCDCTTSCQGGDILYWRWSVDATGTPTTDYSTLNIIGMKMEYTWAPED